MNVFLTTSLRSIRNERGNTLAELLVYSIIMGVLLAGVYVLYEGSNAIYKSANAQSKAQLESRNSQALITRELRMAQTFVIAEDYECEIRADVNDDNLWEEVRFYLDDDRLYSVINGSAPRVLATGVRNQQESEPLFIYYDMSGTNMETDTASRLTKTNEIQVDLLIDADVNNPPDAYRLSTKVSLRNHN